MSDRKRKPSAPPLLSLTTNEDSDSDNLMLFHDDDEEFSQPSPKSPKLSQECTFPRQFSSPQAPGALIMCIICLRELHSYVTEEDLIGQPSAGDGRRGSQSQALAGELRPILMTLKCGHLFHTDCLNKWFMTNRGQILKSCPKCRQEMMACDTKRIFPTLGEE